MKFKLNATTVLLGGVGIYLVSKMLGGKGSDNVLNNTGGGSGLPNSNGTGPVIINTGGGSPVKGGGPMPFSRIGIIVDDAEGLMPTFGTVFHRRNYATSGEGLRSVNPFGFRTF